MNFIHMKIHTYLKDLLSLLYPPLCSACHGELPQGVEHICTKCRYDLPKTRNHILQIPSIEEKFQNIIELEAIFVYCFFEKNSITQRLLHSIKYDENKSLAQLLGSWYAVDLKEDLAIDKFDYIIPVPLHTKKLKKRGFNQSEQIAQGVSQVLNIPVFDALLERRLDDHSLTEMTKTKRIKSLQQVYGINEEHLDNFFGRHLLIIDDVMTTGSTIISCYEALSHIPDVKLSALVLAAAK